MKRFHYTHQTELFAHYLEIQPDTLRYENGYLLTYELSWQFETETMACFDFNQETDFRTTNVMDVIPSYVDPSTIRQIELVKVTGQRLVVNIYVTTKPSRTEGNEDVELCFFYGKGGGVNE
ncbi:TPA_asm: hypothetical protein GIH59_12670 [Listeria monocytogenes]|nr:hypothetical protein [Listeria monocytogenes]